MATIRREEQTKAAAEVGVTELVFLGHSDGGVEFGMELRHEMSRVIRQVRPQVVITQSPHINLDSVYGSHADHVATGQGAWAAVYPDARNPFAFPELLTSGLEPWSVDEIWIMFADATDTVDITDQLERKIRGTALPRSQHRDPDCDGGAGPRVVPPARPRRWLAGWAEASKRFRVVDARLTRPEPIRSGVDDRRDHVVESIEAVSAREHVDVRERGRHPAGERLEPVALRPAGSPR